MWFLFPHYLHQQRMSEIQSHWRQQEFHHQQHCHIPHGTITQHSKEKGNNPRTGTHYYVVKYSIWEEQKRKANQSRQLNPLHFDWSLSSKNARHPSAACLSRGHKQWWPLQCRWGSRREMLQWPYHEAWPYSQQSQEKCNGHSCCSATSVAVPGLFNPLLHEADLQGSSLLYRLGVQRVTAA